MVKRYYRYGMPAEKKLFEAHKDLYDGIVLPAHLVADQTGSLRIFTKKLSKRYFIDPMTHIFAISESGLISPSTGEMRRSYDKLVKRYGSPFNINFKNQCLSPNMFKEGDSFNHEKITACVKVILDFQRKVISEIDMDIVRYSKMVEEIREFIPMELMHKNSPEFLVAPYFFSIGPRDEFYMLNIELAKEAVNQREGDEKIMPILAISPTLLRIISPDDIVRDFEGCNGIIIWVDNLDEQNSSSRDLKSLRNIVKTLTDNEMSTIMMYGGIYSGILHKFGLDGYSSGISYGEKRSKESTIGGPMPLRLFVKEYFTSLSQASATKLYDKLGEYTCTCPICENIRDLIGVERGSDLTGESFLNFIHKIFSEGKTNDHIIGKSERPKEHYMHSSRNILTELESLDIDQLVDILEQKANYIRDHLPDEYEKIAEYLIAWAESIK